ncbi:trafficking protein particle complex subunit 2-like protein isoform X3 [Marmota monax]|uniref:trafficking protein particle complex subunit 2-like protein isoform X3 n=1 Tax=Marmota monax TaxID=9995 RepID=UPI001EB0591F|nr:trafficking protein particle complex subunit 2-like protein isoform X3 [Marmota monax]
MAVCIAVIAKENYPLYIRSTPMESELKFHYMVHTSLDVVDEKISTMGKALVDQRELYLGLLYPTEDYKVLPHAPLDALDLRIRLRPRSSERAPQAVMQLVYTSIGLEAACYTMM